MAKKICERGQTKSWIFWVISKSLYENDTILKLSLNGEFSFTERPKKALHYELRNCWSFENVFCIIYVGDHWTLMCRLTSELLLVRRSWAAELSCSCFCTNYKYERDRTLGDRLDSDQFRGGNGSSWICLLSVKLWERSHKKKLWHGLG